MASGTTNSNLKGKSNSNRNKVPRLGNIDETNRITESSDAESKASTSPERYRKKTLVKNTDAGPRNEDNQYFYEDEVFSFDRKGRVKFGLVRSTESMSMNEDEDFEDPVNPGEVGVAWYPDGNEGVYTQQKLGLADRTLFPGDVIRRMTPGGDPQRGYCRDIDMRTDVKIVGSKYIIKNVDAKRLNIITNMFADSVVWLDSWVGSIKYVLQKAVLKSASGARFEINCADNHTFRNANSRSSGGVFESQCMYQGNYVSGRMLSTAKLLTPNISLPKNAKGQYKKARFYVESVVLDKIVVKWQCKAQCENENEQEESKSQPPSHITGENLKRVKRLKLFEALITQMGDRAFLKFSKTDTVMKKSQWEQELCEKYRSLFEKQKQMNEDTFPQKTPHTNDSNKSDAVKKCNGSKSVKKDGKKVSVENANTDLNNVKTGCEQVKDDNVIVQDQEWESDEDLSSPNEISHQSIPLPRHISKQYHEKLRNLKVRNLKKLSPPLKATKSDCVPKNGNEIVVEVMLVYSNVTVVWQDGTVEENINSTELYPINHIDNNDFFPGDYIVDNKDDDDASNYRDYGVIQTVDHVGRTAVVKWFTTYSSTDTPIPSYKGETEVSVYNIREHPDYQYRPGSVVIRVSNFADENAKCTTGQIVDNYPEGRVKVHWIEGHENMCWPQDLFEVRRQEGSNWSRDSESESWETESENSEIGGNGNPGKKSVGDRFLANVENTLILITNLVDVFRSNPQTPNAQVISRLLELHNRCLTIDFIMNTVFFQGDDFDTLMERVRAANYETMPKTPPDQKLQSSSHQSDRKTTNTPKNPISKGNANDPNQVIQALLNLKDSSNQKLNTHMNSEYVAKVLRNFSISAAKAANFVSSVFHNGTGASCSITTVSSLKSANNETKNPNDPNGTNTQSNGELVVKKNDKEHIEVSIELQLSSIEDFEMIQMSLVEWAIESVDKACRNPIAIGEVFAECEEYDSGNFSRNENFNDSCGNNSDINDDQTKKENAEKLMDSPNGIENAKDEKNNLEYIRFCGLLKSQMKKCINEIQLRLESNTSNAPLNCDDDVDDEFSEESVMAFDTKSMTAFDTESAVAIENATEQKAEQVIEKSPQNLPLPDQFQVLSNAPKNHKHYSSTVEPNNSKQYYRAIQREYRMLKSSLPPGVWVRAYEDRMDLISVMIEGPKNTPYEDALFLFDMQLDKEYPHRPPICYYLCYCTDRLNPNLYADGTVCVSLLGTWTGRNTEIWGPDSTLLQLIVSIQGLILVPEPYFNEAGYERQKDTQEGTENSRVYNEMAIIKVVQATTKLLYRMPEVFAQEIERHFRVAGPRMHKRLRNLIHFSQHINEDKITEDQFADLAAKFDYNLPGFSLLPGSRGFCITLSDLLNNLESALKALETKTEQTTKKEL